MLKQPEKEHSYTVMSIKCLFTVKMSQVLCYYVCMYYRLYFTFFYCKIHAENIFPGPQSQLNNDYWINFGRFEVLWRSISAFYYAWSNFFVLQTGFANSHVTKKLSKSKIKKNQFQVFIQISIKTINALMTDISCISSQHKALLCWGDKGSLQR